MMQSLIEAESGSEKLLRLVTRNKDDLPRLISKMGQNHKSLYRSIKYWQNERPEHLNLDYVLLI